eukprot:167679-Amphidinium_carterae.1
MEVGTGRKRAAETEADDTERAARGSTDLLTVSLRTASRSKSSNGMSTLSLLLAEGATVLFGHSRPELHDQFIDGR